MGEGQCDRNEPFGVERRGQRPLLRTPKWVLSGASNIRLFKA